MHSSFKCYVKVNKEHIGVTPTSDKFYTRFDKAFKHYEICHFSSY